MTNPEQAQSEGETIRQQASEWLIRRRDSGSWSADEEEAFKKPFASRPSHDQAVRGEILYTKVCSRCHVFGPGMLPDLRRISESTYQLFFEIVLRGAFVPKGMGQFSDELTQDQAADIRAFLTDEAWKAFEGQPATHTGQAH